MNATNDRRKQAAAALLAAAAALLSVACSGADTDAHQSGGGGAPPSDLASVVQSLPGYPGMAENQAAAAIGRAAVQAFFWAPDSPAQVAEFYAAELPGRGWRPLDDAPVGSVSGAKDDGTTTELLTQRFRKGNFVLTVVTRPNQKDPDRGQTHLSFEVVEQN